jgi:hypothetical protein
MFSTAFRAGGLPSLWGASSVSATDIIPLGRVTVLCWMLATTYHHCFSGSLLLHWIYTGIVAGFVANRLFSLVLHARLDAWAEVVQGHCTVWVERQLSSHYTEACGKPSVRC